MSKFLSIGDLLKNLEKLRSKNRDLLSVEEVQVLDDCVRALKELQKHESDEKSEEIFEKSVKVMLHLLKLISDVNLSDCM